MKIYMNNYFQNKLYFCLTQIRELQFKYPDLWLVNANLNNGISILISLIIRIKTQITELQFKYPVTEWNAVEHVVMNIDESVFRIPIYSVQANYIVMNIDESVFCIPIYSVQGRYYPDLWLDKANLNNGIVNLYKTIMNIDEPTMLLQGDIYALNSIQDQEIQKNMKKIPFGHRQDSCE